MGKKNKKSSPKTENSKDSKALVLFPALNAVLQPSAEYIGAELRDGLRTKIEAWKQEKADKRAAEQFERLRDSFVENNIEEFKPSPRQEDILEDWIDCVKTTAPDDEISALWRELLVDEALGKTASPYALRLLRKLEPIEARVLLKFFNSDRSVPYIKPSQTETQVLDYLAQHGAITRDGNKRHYVTAVTLAALVGVLGMVLQPVIGNYGLSMMLTVAGIASFLVFGATYINRPWRLTETGRSLMKYSNAKTKN